MGGGRAGIGGDSDGAGFVTDDQQVGGGWIIGGGCIPQPLHIVLDGGGIVCHGSAAADGRHDHRETLLGFPVHIALDVAGVADRAEDDHFGGMAHFYGAVVRVPVENGSAVKLFKLPGSCPGKHVSGGDEVWVDKIHPDIHIFHHLDTVGDGVVAHRVKIEGENPYAAHHAQFRNLHPVAVVELVEAVKPFVHLKGQGGGIGSSGDGLLSRNDAVLQFAGFAVQFPRGL
ncbi:MAG: hypothetical protein BWX75_01217 [Candidatus Cloacimonetes bacterium ADurb.Bin088]|nr:MAG: hypothetical protein BWX75_01217 [Candidatus Cloacimonetes bacterium ADurb.Bin088]